MNALLLFAAVAITTVCAVSAAIYWRMHKTSLSEATTEAITLHELPAEEGVGVNDQLGKDAASVKPHPATAGLRLDQTDLSQHPVPRHRADSGQVPFSMEFSYLDPTGYYTRRAVSVQVCDSEHFAGHCYLRDAYRTFAWDNIVGFVVLFGTNEVVEVEEARARFG